MLQKSALLSLLFTFSCLFTLAQEILSVLSAPEAWPSEHIPFPLIFAPDIAFNGFEDLRFTPGWSDSTRANFWTYTFAWYIENDSEITDDQLAKTFDLYYDGLMGIAHRIKSDSVNVKWTKSIFEGNEGTISVYDGFFTHRTMMLHVKVSGFFCNPEQMQLLRFEISPQPFEHEVWKMFKEVTLRLDCH